MRIFALRGSILRKSSLRTRPDSSAICPAISTPVGPASDDHEGEPLPLLLRILLELGHLERPQNPAAELEGVVDRFHAGRPARELVVAEVGLAGAGGDDQAVVRDLDGAPVGARGRHRASLEVEAGHLGQLDLDISMAAQNASDRRGDLARREDPGRHLVEQRLEEVVVVAVHQRHPDRARDGACARRTSLRSLRPRSRLDGTRRPSSVREAP